MIVHRSIGAQSYEFLKLLTGTMLLTHISSVLRPEMEALGITLRCPSNRQLKLIFNLDQIYNQPKLQFFCEFVTFPICHIKMI